LRPVAKLIQPELSPLENRFLTRLVELGFDKRQRAALRALTFGAVARIVSQGRRTRVFVEQVEYHGRRLAKLNLPPSDIVEALTEYDRLLTPVLMSLLRGEYTDFQWVRDQLHFCVILTLNRAYYEVRETEAHAFYELFRTELEARNLDALLVRSLSVLTRFCGAQEAQLYLLDDNDSNWVRKATVRSAGRQTQSRIRGEVTVAVTAHSKRQLSQPRCMHITGRPNKWLLDRVWKDRYVSAWSIPLLSGERVAGVMQFAFTKRYDWLPRERELLEAAAERSTVAAEKAKLIEDLGAREEQIRRLAEHMLHIEEVERRRISRELHDEAGQSLLYIRLQLEMLENELTAEQPEWRDRIKGVREVTEHTILETRRLIAALSPAVLEQLGLAAAVRQLITRFRQLNPCRVRLNLSALDNLPKQTETVVYRLVQECCNNIAKHSHALNVNISLTSADGLLRLNVEDDGVGFKVAEALTKRNSFGLAGMRERVTLLGGNLEIESWTSKSAKRKRSGARIIVELPISQNT
jgi:signal transduction histidine kinase